MTELFGGLPEGLEPAPANVQQQATAHQVTLSEIKCSGVGSKAELMQTFATGLHLPDWFGRNWDALYDVLTDPDQMPAHSGLLLRDYAHFKTQYPKLAAELEGVLLDAQADAAGQGRKLWLLSLESSE